MFVFIYTVTFASSKSFVINFNQVCSWPPLGFSDNFCASLYAFFANASSGKRERYPYNKSGFCGRENIKA